MDAAIVATKFVVGSFGGALLAALAVTRNRDRGLSEVGACAGTLLITSVALAGGALCAAW